MGNGAYLKNQNVIGNMSEPGVQPNKMNVPLYYLKGEICESKSSSSDTTRMSLRCNRKPLSLNKNEILSSKKETNCDDMVPTLVYFNSKTLPIRVGDGEFMDIRMYLHSGSYVEAHFSPLRTVLEIAVLRCKLGQEIDRLFINFDLFVKMWKSNSSQEEMVEFIADDLIVKRKANIDEDSKDFRTDLLELGMKSMYGCCIIRSQDFEERCAILKTFSLSLKFYPDRCQQ
jgi:hypothetical protein